MIKAGLIGSALGFIYVMGLTLFSPFCTLCFTPLWGFGAGYMACWFDNPTRMEATIVRGVGAGGLTGLGIVLGQIMATLINGVLVTNSEQLPKLMQDFGLSSFVITNPDEYWQATVTLNAFCGFFNLALVLGLSLLGSTIWFRRHKARLMTLETNL